MISLFVREEEKIFGKGNEIHCTPAAVSVVCGCFLDVERIVHLFTVFIKSEIRLQR
jgi:hypothetical protein